MLNKKLTTAITTVTTIASLLIVPAVASADTGVLLTGNGAGSDNSVTTNSTNTTTGSQTNNANVNNTVDAKASTGNNNSSFNTGGTSEILTGNASNSVAINNALNSNQMSLSGGCNCGGGSAVVLDGNGAFSASNANLNSTNTTNASQDNNAYVNNDVTAKALTGGNSAVDNTGGNNLVLTGSAINKVGISTQANSNTAVLGGNLGTGAGFGAGTDARILGNGALSNSTIGVSNNNATTVAQDNLANVSNSVQGGASTGENDNSFGTGGSSLISTGGAANWTGVSNMLNANFVDASQCSCMNNVLGKIVSNGAFSTGAIDTTNNNAVDLTGSNNAALNNDITPHAQSGSNSSLDNTAGFFGGDPSVMTGTAYSTTQLSNQTNLNVVHSNGISTPMGNISLGFDPSALWSWMQ